MSSVRKFVQSKRYSPTTSSTSALSAGGYVNRLSAEGVRKQLTSAPRNGRGGYVPGTPTTIELPPARPTRSHSRGALIALPSAMNAPSYVWSARFRKPYTPRSPGVRLAIMHDHAGTVIGGTIEVSRPDTPRSISPDRTGSRSRQRSSTSDGSAQSSPMIITFFATASATEGMVVADPPSSRGQQAARRDREAIPAVLVETTPRQGRGTARDEQTL